MVPSAMIHIDIGTGFHKQLAHRKILVQTRHEQRGVTESSTMIIDAGLALHQNRHHFQGVGLGCEPQQSATPVISGSDMRFQNQETLPGSDSSVFCSQECQFRQEFPSLEFASPPQLSYEFSMVLFHCLNQEFRRGLPRHRISKNMNLDRVVNLGPDSRFLFGLGVKQGTVSRPPEKWNCHRNGKRNF